MDNNKLGIRVSVVTIAVNITLSVFKFIAGIAGRSSAMISDAVHSASDVFSTFIVIAGIKVSAKESDKHHPYGHERMECIAAMILAAVLCVTGLGIGYAGVINIIGESDASSEIPGGIALVSAIFSIIVKEWMYWYTVAAAKKIDSDALMADAWHHRSDALSSIGAFVGILGARLGYPVLDSVASVIICIFILKAAFDIFRDAMNKMVDSSCSADVEQLMIDLIGDIDGVLGVSELKTRLFGSKIYVDVVINADGDKTLREAHAIAENVHDAIESKFSNVKHCMVHVDPK